MKSMKSRNIPEDGVSVRERQQVVELVEMECLFQKGAALKNSTSCADARNLNPRIMRKSLSMEKLQPNSHITYIPSSDNIAMKQLSIDRIYFGSNTAEVDIDSSPEIENLSRQTSHSSEQSYSSENENFENTQAKKHPHIRFAYSEFEGGRYVPNKSPSRFSNSHSSFDNLDDSFLKQIDNTRRDAVMTLSQKREKKAELVRKISERSQDETIGICKLTRYNLSMSFQKFKEAFGSVSYTLELWYSSLKLIEGHFGSGVASYFRFLRWLFLLNLTTLIISFSFLILPQMLLRFYLNFNEVPEVAKNGGTYFEKTFFDIADSNGTLPPPLTAASLIQRSNPYHENENFSWTDIFTGEGFLTNTAMYYGFYKAGTVELFESYLYDVPNAYFFTMSICYVIILIAVSMSMASSYRKTFIETRGAQMGSLSLKLFCGWDFGIATEEAASLNRKRLQNEIKEALNEIEFQSRVSSCLSRFTNVTVQLALNILFFCLMGGIAVLMWDLLGRHSAHLSSKSAGGSGNTMIMAVITSVIMNVLPICFSWIVRYEDYKNPRTALFVTLLRTFLLNIIVIGTTAVFWLTHSQECWETALGQEVYRLFVIDFLISILLMGLVETVWSCIQRKFWKEHGPPEFDIAWNTLNLIYNETLFLVGFYFSPWLSAVIVIKLFITFYIKKAGALCNCQPPRKSWRAAQTHTLFLILTFIALLGVFLVFGYIIFRVSPSQCGPFSGYSYMYEAILNRIFQLKKDNLFWQAVMYLAKPGVVGGILIAMSIATYILRAKAHAHAIEADILNNMLVNETKDKAFLFKYIKIVEEMNKKKISPAVSNCSPFHTPLAERRLLKRASKERQSFLVTPRKGAKNLIEQKKFHSTGHITQTGWSFRRPNVRTNDSDEPSTSSGGSTSRTTCEISDPER
ncbi:transmembrane channel-like protein 5 isoform X1 [Frankliniella occidentalis]|uniref:Transmembrane channel-like protein 5 isoform X1 n=2 Tax=Frankliniella occidentalis TaxID=133901 RepID=A0A6J1T0E3_FRAOC|nr:transmembrane channel-like protein 5 isoform X1 [Frankliniella occidentalis]